MKRAIPITTLFLDIGGVLLTNGWDHQARQRAATHFKLDWNEMEDRHHLTFDTYEEGKLTLGEYLGRVVYQVYEEIFNSARFRTLAGQGACTQRLLWASTSTKNPEYSDVKYVEALIGRDTVDTAPMETIDAYRDHGQPQDRIEQEVAKARGMLDRLPELGISLDQVTQQLENEGVAAFSKAFDKLMATLEKAVHK
jgi:transaldolase